jgi:hypothetical protein
MPVAATGTVVSLECNVLMEISNTKIVENMKIDRIERHRAGPPRLDSELGGRYAAAARPRPARRAGFESRRPVCCAGDCRKAAASNAAQLGTALQLGLPRYCSMPWSVTPGRAGLLDRDPLPRTCRAAQASARHRNTFMSGRARRRRLGPTDCTARPRSS